METEKWLEKVTWKNVHVKMARIHPELATIINEISPSDDYPLYIARYPYGAFVLDKGIFQVIDDRKYMIPLNESSFPNSIKEDLGYNNTLPTGIVSRNSLETFFIAGNRIIPASLYGVGNIASLWRVLEGDESYQLGPLWSVTSGARTICMLPKITDKTSYRSLKSKYGKKLPEPKALNEHWHIFSYLANHEKFEENWSSEIIFFSRKWFLTQKDKHWCKFYNYLLNDVWQSSSFRRNQFIFDFAFSLTQENKNLKPNPYLADTVKHLVAIGSGSSPAMTIATDNSAAPVKELQKIFIEDYGLKKYAPIIMHLHHFSPSENRPVYYSLEMPTTTIFSPRSSRLSSKMVDMRELKHIIETLFAEILKNNVYIEKTPLFNLAKNVTYQFFHSEKDQLNEVLHVTDLLNLDKSFTKTLIDSKNYAPPEFSPFFRGCIAVAALK